MGLNKQKGNMYGFVTHTWNAIKGKCSHGCDYCYMKPLWRGNIHLDNKELKTNLGEDNYIFVGSSTDMFAEDVPYEWITKVLKHCTEYFNTYLFQSKNPKRFIEVWSWFPTKCILGTTIESNREYLPMNNAPRIKERVEGMLQMTRHKKMVTIEPIMNFDLKSFVKIIKEIKPEFVNIGADSKGHNLSEPSSEDIRKLIKELKKFTKVNLKENLKRLYSQNQGRVKK